MMDVQPPIPRVAPQQPTLLAPRLRLRPLRPHDAALIALHASDWKVARMTTGIPHPYPPGTAEALIARALTDGSDGTVWAIDSGAEDENGLIGMIRLRPKSDGAGVIGYWVAPAFWGSGYAGEAVEAVKEHAAELGMPLTAEVMQDNVASVRVLTRAGFGYTGEGETYSLARGGMVPVFCYRWTRESVR